MDTVVDGEVRSHENVPSSTLAVIALNALAMG